MKLHPQAGHLADASALVNIPQLITAYYSVKPDPAISAHRVAFGTSGHRGSSLHGSFNEDHILAITQAICIYRQKVGISGPLFMGMDTHALSTPALATALEVLAANGVIVMLAENDEYTPTPVISHAILSYNKNRKTDLSDGIVITPSHNPPDQGGFKYNPPNGGPASQEVTDQIGKMANQFLIDKLNGIKRFSYKQSIAASTTRFYDYITPYIVDLANVVDMKLISDSHIHMGVDPLGGAGVHYWQRIADHYKLNLDVISNEVDPTFRFMTLDWDGQIRMDPSSAYAMKRLLNMRQRYDISFACDTDHDRHGIVTQSQGLMLPTYYLAVMTNYLYQHRPEWNLSAAIGKTVVNSSLIDKVAASLQRQVYEVPVGFKWFVDGLFNSSLTFAGEESAGATFARFDGAVWTTDKDGIIPSLLAGEMTARMGQDPGILFQQLNKKFGPSFYDRSEAAVNTEQKKRLANLSEKQLSIEKLTGEKVTQVLTHAPGNGASIGGVKVVSENGWFAARPSGTEDIYKIYAESFKSEEHLKAILNEAESIVLDAISGS